MRPRRRITVELDVAGDALTMLVHDDGVGIEPGTVSEIGGLGNMRDRIDSVGGRARRPSGRRGRDRRARHAAGQHTGGGGLSAVPLESSPGLSPLVSAALTVLDTVLVAVSVPLLSAESVGIHGWPLVNAASLASAVLGAVIVSSDPRHPIGWLLTFVGVTTTISLAAESYGVWVLEHGGHGSISPGTGRRLDRRGPRWSAGAHLHDPGLPPGSDGQLPLTSVAMGDARCRDGLPDARPADQSGAGEDRHRTGGEHSKGTTGGE